jgi:thioredoxin-like negative regulator of GroEL
LTKEYINSLLKDEVGVILYFSTKTCNVCKVLKPKIEEKFKDNFPDIKMEHIDCEKYPEISANYSVFSVPTILVFLQGKEFVREGRNVSVDILVDKIRRPYNIMKS